MLARTQVADKTIRLNSWINYGFHPHIPIGYINKAAFCLMPNSTHLLPTDLEAVDWNRQKRPRRRMPGWSTNNPTATTSASTPLKTDILPFMILGINRCVIPAEEQDTLTDETKSEASSSAEGEAGQADLCNTDSTDASKGDSFRGGEDEDSDGQFSYTAEDDDSGVVRDLFGDEPTEQQVPSVIPPGTVLPSADPLEEGSKSSWSRDSFRESEESYNCDGFTSANDENGFSFYQLGALQYTFRLSDPRTTDKKALARRKWCSTGYILVAEIERKEDDCLRLGTVWMLFNYRPENEDGDPKRYVIEPFQQIPGDPENKLYSGLRIAVSFSDFGPDYSLPISNVDSADRIDHDFELVACHRIDSDKRIIRQYEGKSPAS